MNIRRELDRQLEAGYARKPAIAAPPLRFEPLDGRALGFTVEGIGGSRPSVRPRMSRIPVRRLFEPAYGLADARLQQVDHSDPPVPIVDPGIAWAEPDCLLLRGNRLLYCAREKLALTERRQGEHPAGIECDCGLVFGNRSFEAALRAQGLSSGEMRHRMARRYRQRLSD